MIFGLAAVFGMIGRIFRKRSMRTPRQVAHICDYRYLLKTLQFFSCGSGKVATGIKATLIQIIKGSLSTDDATALASFEKISKDRYATDIFD